MPRPSVRVCGVVAIALMLGTAGSAWARDAREGGRVLKAGEATEQQPYAQEAEGARREAIERLKVLLQEAEGPIKVEMMLRLADLYFEEGRSLYLAEIQQYQEAYDKCFDTPDGCNPADIHQSDYTSGANVWQEKSIKLYRVILDNYPTWERADEAEFYLGQALADLGRADESNTAFTHLVKTWPDSRFVPDAYVFIGEYWFDHNVATKAMVAYQRAAAYKDHDKYAFALYKLAWCQYNLGEPGEAADTMLQVVEWSSQKGQRAAITLQEEALKDLVRFYADLGDLELADQVFTRLGKQASMVDVYVRLASTLEEQGKFEQAITTWRRAIAKAPESEKAPQYADGIVRVLMRMDRKQEAFDEMMRFRQAYGPKSAWARANAVHPEAATAAWDLYEKELRTAAVAWHNVGRKLRGGPEVTKGWALAEAAYDVYLQDFGNGTYATQMRYNFAELLYTLKKYDRAYDQYMAVVAADPKGEHAKFCAESAIFAAEAMEKAHPAEVSGTAPVALSEWAGKELVALDQFAKLYPDEPKLRGVIYKAGWIHYRHNQFAEAAERFNVVIRMDPKSRDAEQAAHLMLDSFALVQDWDALRKNARLYYDQPGLGSATFKQEVYGIYESATLKGVEAALAKGGDKAAAAQGYRAFYGEFPSSAKADLALNNAAVYFHDAGRLADAIEARETLVSQFPRSKYRADTLAALAFDLESVARFSDAAKGYETLAAEAPDHASAADAIYSAAVLRESLGQWEAAVADYQRYVTRYPGRANTNGVILEIAQIQEANGREAEALTAYQRFAAKPPVGASVDERMFARLHAGLLMGRLGQAAKVHAWWKDSVAWFENARAADPTGDHAAANGYAAQMRFDLAQPQYQAFLALKIDGPRATGLTPNQVDRVLTAQLTAKVQAVKELEKTYASVIGTGAGEWGLAALDQLGSAYEDLAAALRGSYVPDYLTADQREIYEMKLDDMAYAQDEKAGAAYAAALDRSRALNLYDANTAHATRRLGALRPEEYPPLTEQILKPGFAAPATFAGGFETGM